MTLYSSKRGWIVYLMYVDESGDPGNNTLQTDYFCLSGIVVHESEWRQFVDALVVFRRTMKAVYGLPIRSETHTTEFIRKNAFGIAKHDRLSILRNFLDELAKLNSISLTNIVVDKRNKPQEFDIFEAAWRTLFQRFENTLTHGNYPGGYKRSFGCVFTDATAGKKLSGMMRRMVVHNPVPNRQGEGYRNIPIQRIIEDPSERDSKTSLPIQACDVAAYFLHQRFKANSYVKRKGAAKYFDRLAPILNVHASIRNDHGIVVV
ncbi:DUF3800 domain-containing protein [Tateyamaria sp.]|uniref:DUF3800 domain-containing protein n=1 Tax=Tateyamaria sp. TaxID=1929288 RepID=UPI0032A0793F